VANFRTTADLLDDVLRHCGEVTSDQGTSSLQSAALLYLNQIHNTVITGGNELEVDIDESWVWAQARRPLILNLNPPVTAGSVTLNQGSVTGTFSTAPQVNGASASVEGWYLKPDGGPEVYRIIQHTSGQTSFQLDCAFPQSNYASTFHCFQLEYDLTPSYIVIDQYNDTLDFISRGTTVQTATMTHGAYTPGSLATHAASVLTSTDTNGNTYTGSYDSISRNFTLTSNLGGTATALFTVTGNGTNYYRSGWSTLGFDYLSQSGSASYSSAYPLGATARLTQPGRIYYGYSYGLGQQSGQICALDPRSFDRDFNLINVRQGTPDYFMIVGEHAQDGRISIRLNKYPSQAMRIEFDHIPYPRDLQNNAQSVPRIPRKWNRILTYGAAYYLLLNKQDNNAGNYLQLSQQMLKGMMKANRQDLLKTGRNFGNVVARPDMLPEKSYRRLMVWGYDSDNS